jgi:hypothetical protein
MSIKCLIVWKRAQNINLSSMKTPFVIPGLFLLAGFIPCLGQAAPAPAPTAPTTAPAPPQRVLFQAPDDDSGGVLPNRVGGGSRGAAGDTPTLEVLVPDHVALTTEARPLLYWYQNAPSKVKFEISVTEPKNPKPLMLVQTSGAVAAGVHCFRVATDLKPTVLYRWSVAAVLDPANRSQDVVANGVIKRIEPPAKLSAQLSQAREQDKPALYAASGIWYDALESLSTQIQHAPADDALKAERADLLKQINLADVKFDAAPMKSR